MEPEIKRAWDADQALRAEFDGDYEAFAHFVVADEMGLVNVLRGGQSIRS